MLAQFGYGTSTDDVKSATDIVKSGNDFLRICKAPGGPHADAISLICTTYIKGVWDGFYAYGAVTKIELYDFSANMTVGQVKKIVVKYMNDHPKQLHLPTAALILIALVDAYPPKKNPR